MIKNFFRGLTCYVEAMGVIGKARLWRYFLYSGMIGLVVFGAFGYLIFHTHDILSDFIFHRLPWSFTWIGTAGDWITIIFSSILFLMLFRYVMLVVLAPLMSQLSADVEHYLYGTDDRNADIGTFFQELIRGIRVAIRNFIREILWTLVIFILGLFPILTLFTGPLVIIVQSYYAGFGTMDYWAERHLSYHQTLDYLPRQKGMLIANGLVYIFLIMVPVAGVILIPTLSTTAATLHACENWEINTHQTTLN